MDIRTVLAKRIRSLMAERVSIDTQQKLADRAGISQSTVQRILNCDQAATVEILEKLARACGVEPGDLLALDDDSANLLGMYRRLSDSDRQRVLGFLQVTTEAEAARATIDFQSSRLIPVASMPAIQRAVRAPLVADPVTPRRTQDATTTRPGRRAVKQ